MIPFLIFDSVDKTGKDTLISEFHKRTNYKYPCINRFTGTHFSYGKFKKRDLNFKEYLDIDKDLINNGILIYLYSSKTNIRKRFKKHNEKDIKIKDIDIVLKYYRQYLNLTPLRVLEVNTDNKIEDCVNLILQELVRFEEEKPIDKIKRLRNYITSNGTKLDNTKEIQNVKFNYIRDGRVEPSDNELLKNEMLNYNEILSAMEAKVFYKLKYETQTKESRQFVYTSDSCISFYQVMKRNNTLYITASIRSSDIDLLNSDLNAIHILGYTLNKKYFNCKKLNITVNVTSLHRYKK